MAVQQEVKVPVLGLNVDANRLAAPPGSLAVADNVTLRTPGNAKPCRAPVSVAGGDDPRIANYTPDVGTYGVRVFCAGDDNVLGVEGASRSADATKLRLSTNPMSEYSTVPLGTGTRSLVFNNQRTGHVFSDGRHFLTSDSGVIAIDGTDTSSNQVPRLAGLVSPVAIVAAWTVSTSYPVVATDGSYVSYVAVLRRRVGSTYTLYSSPTQAAVTTHSGADFGVLLTVYLGAYDDYVAGDEIVVYKTNTATSADGIIEFYRECLVHTITSAERAANQVSLTDVVHDTALNGAELYTNSGQDGPVNVNYVPPLSADVCAYANSVLYSNKLSWPTLALEPSVTGTFAVGTPERVYGIGLRPITVNLFQTSPIKVSDAEVVGLAVGQRITRHFGTFFSVPIITSIVHNGVNDNDVFYSGTLDGPPTYTAYTVDAVTLTFGTTGVTTNVPVVGWDVQRHLTLAALALPGIRALDGYTYVATVPGTCDSITATPTNGANYANAYSVGGTYQVDSVQDTRRNIMWFSKPQQPEAVSPVANFPVGVQTILRTVKVGNSALSFCTDGLWAIQGDADNGFQVQQLDAKCRLYHPSAVAVLGNDAYALTYSGVLRVGENGRETISANAVDTIIQDMFVDWPETWEFSAVADEVNNEVRFSSPDGRTLVYNAVTGQWAVRVDGMLHGAFDRGKNAVGRRAPDVIITTVNGYFCDGGHAAAATVKHNPITGSAPATVKQYIDTNHLFEDGATGTYTLTFDGTASRSVTVDADTTVSEAHCRVPRRAARKPRLTVGFETAVSSEFEYSGFRARFRASTDEVKK